MAHSYKTELTNVAPHGSPVDRISRPNDSIHELNQASHRGPEHIDTRSSVPCVQMPGKRDESQDECKERNNGKERVCWVMRDHGRMQAVPGSEMKEVVQERERMPFRCAARFESQKNGQWKFRTPPTFIAEKGNDKQSFCLSIFVQ